MKIVLNVIVDMLTLLALCVAAIGHVLPWFDRNRMTNMQVFGRAAVDLAALTDFQQWHAVRSGTALGILAMLVCLSLVINWGPAMRRVLNLGMFACAFVALLFELLIFSNYELVGPQRHLQINDTEGGYGLAMIPTCFALFFCLLRMIWTMPPTRPTVPAMDLPEMVPPAAPRRATPDDRDNLAALELEYQSKHSGYTERRGG